MADFKVIYFNDADKIIESVFYMEEGFNGYLFLDKDKSMVSFVPYSNQIKSIDVVEPDEDVNDLDVHKEVANLLFAKDAEDVMDDPYAGEFSLLPNDERLMPGDVIDNGVSRYLVSLNRKAVYIGRSTMREVTAGTEFETTTIFDLSSGILIPNVTNRVYREGKILWEGRV